MRRIIPLLLLIFVTCVVSNAQVTRQQARDAEWKSYQLPKTNFARQMSPEKEFIFRVPADWKQQGTELYFEGPHTATLQVFVQKVPDGYPLQDLFGTMLQTVKDAPGAAETVVTRKIQLQDLEAREIFMELPDDEGELFRSCRLSKESAGTGGTSDEGDAEWKQFRTGGRARSHHAHRRIHGRGHVVQDERA